MDVDAFATWIHHVLSIKLSGTNKIAAHRTLKVNNEDNNSQQNKHHLVATAWTILFVPQARTSVTLQNWQSDTFIHYNWLARCVVVSCFHV